MSWQETPYTLPLFLAAVISATLALYSWRRRSAPGAAAASLLMLGSAQWALGYALELISGDLPLKVFWAKIQYLGIVTVPAAWLLLTLHYTGQQYLIAGRRLALLVLEPLITLALVFTNESHGLIWSRLALDDRGTYSLLNITHGPAFWVHAAYSYTLLALGCIVLLQALLHAFALYRLQAIALLVAIVTPWLGNFLYLSGLNPFPGLDLTPFAFVVTNLSITWSLFRLRLLDIVPVAHQYTIQSMSDGVVVLDAQDRIVDLNPSARHIFRRLGPHPVGTAIADLLPDWSQVVLALHQGQTTHVEVTLDSGAEARTYDLSVSPMFGWRGQHLGRVLVLRDVTDRKRMEEERQRLLAAEREQRLLAETLREVTLALTSHTSHEAVLDEILRQAHRLVPHETANIVLLEGDTLHIARWRGYEAFNCAEFMDRLTQRLADFPSIAETVRTGQPEVVADTREHPGWVVLKETAWIRSHISVPICLHDRVLGLLRLDSATPGRFSQADAERLRPLATAAAIALENARLHEEKVRLLEAERAARQRAERLQAATQALSATLNLQEVFQRILNELQHVVPYDSASVQELRGDRMVIIGGHGFPNLEEILGLDFDLTTGDNPNREVVLTRASVILPDAPAEYNDFHREPHAQAGIRSWMGVPLLFGDRLIGMITLDKQEPGFYTEEHARLAQAFAAQAAIAIENARLYEEARRQTRELATLLEIATATSSTLDLERVLHLIVRKITEAMDVSGCALSRWDREADTVITWIEWSRDKRRRADKPGTAYPLSGFPATRAVLQERRPLVVHVSDPDADAAEVALMKKEGVNTLLMLPLVAGDRVIGLVEIDESGRERQFTPRDIQFCQALVSQAAIAIENARLMEETRHRAQQLATLNELARRMTGLLEMRELSTTVAEYLCSVFGYFNVGIFTLDRGTRRVVLAGVAGAYADIAQPGTYAQALGEGIIGRAAATGRAIVVNDTSRHPDFFELEGMNVRAEAAIPLKVGDQVVGVLNVDSERVNAFDEDKLALLTTVADQLAVAMEKARLYQETRRRARELEVVSEILQALNATPDVIEAFPVVVSNLRAVTRCERASLALVHEDGQSFTLVVLDQPRAELGQGVRMPYSATSAAEDVLAGRLHVTPDLAEEADHPAEQALYQAGHRSRINVPLRVGDQVIGALNLTWTQRAGYETSQFPLLRQVADAMALAIERSRLLQESRRQAQELASLYNTALIVGSVLDTKSLLARLYKQVRGLITLDSFGVVLYHGETEEVEVLLAMEADVPVPGLGGMRVSLAEAGLTGWVIQHRQPLLIGDLEAEDLPVPPRHLTRPARSWLGVPLAAHDRLIGAISVQSFQPNAFGANDRRFLELLASQVAVALENARLFEETRRLLEQVQQQALRVQRIMDTAPEGVILLDAEKRVLLANPVAQEYLAVLSNAGINDVLTHLGAHSIDYLLRSSLQRGRHEVAVVGPPRRIFEVAARPIASGPEGGGWVLAISDVTREREVQERIQQQERLAAVGQLAAGIAHDFNNILQGVIGFADLLAQRSDIPADACERLRMIAQQGERGARLVRQILDFSRQSLAEKHPLNLVPFVKETVRFLRSILPENIHISLEIKPGTYVVNADLAQLQQVLANLATNARDAMPQGGELHVGLSPLTLAPGEERPLPEMPPGRWVVLTVTDTGSGIPPDVLPHIFEPFFTTKSPDKGTGLGLAQVYGIVRQHEGYIDVTTEPGQGTTFTIYLPALSVSQATTPGPDRLYLPPGDNLLVLVVEDEPHVLTAAEDILRSLGYRVITAGSGEEALALYRTHRAEIDLVLTDWVMPAMSGLDLARALREEGARVPVIVMTGHPVGEDVRSLTAPGVSAWLSKPFNKEELGEVLAEVMTTRGRD